MLPTDSEVLKKSLPVAAVEPIRHLLNKYHVNLIVSRDRRSKNGDFRPGINGQSHSISVNGSLNKYEFLLVVLHELAHVIVFENVRGRRIPSHGKEWKQQYGALLREAADNELFDPNIRLLVYKYSYHVKASGVADLELVKALRAFDNNNGKPTFLLLDELPEGSVFKAQNGRSFIKGAKVRKRYFCACTLTGKRYFVNPMLKVTHQKNTTDNPYL